MSKPHYRANRDRWQLEMSWNDLASSGCLQTWGCSRIPQSLAGALPAVCFPRPLSSWGEQLGCWVQLGLEVGEECEGESIRFISSLLGDAALPWFPSWLLFVAAFCQDVPSTVRSLLLWEMDVTRSQDDSVFSSGVAWWVTAGETVSLEHTTDTMHGMTF